MILLLDTSTPVCRLTLIDGDEAYEYSWESGRELAKGLLGYIETCLDEHDKTLDDIEKIGVYQGPGSFTGLRIGITVVNTIADAREIAIVGESGETWQAKAIQRLNQGENDQIVMPAYGSEAHITKQRK